MKIINIQAAKTHLSRLVEDAVAGEEIVIAKAGNPMVTLSPYSKSRVPRKGDYMKDHPEFNEDVWKEDPEITSLFLDGEIFPKSE